jgi:hypothetical protein
MVESSRRTELFWAMEQLSYKEIEEKVKLRYSHFYCRTNFWLL